MPQVSQGADASSTNDVDQAAHAALVELCRSGSPVIREDRIDETLAFAHRRWRSFGRRHPKNINDTAARINDLAKGLRDNGETRPLIVGPLIEDYRFVAVVLADVFSPEG